MSTDQPSYVIKITRYGLPLVVGIFYFTASLGLEFTDDSALQMAGYFKHGFASPVVLGSPSPLWWFLLGIGGWFHLDIVLVAKVLSLLFGCATVLAGYLVANEILRDHLLAFCISLVLAMQGWLLQLAPSGSAFTLAIVLILVALFFTLRNEYVVAPFVLGLGTLVFWQAVFFLVPFLVDIRINSVDKRRAWKVMLRACVVYVGALLPWGGYAWLFSAKGIPVLLQVEELPAVSVTGTVAFTILGIVCIVGIVRLLISPNSRTELLRSNGVAFLFIGVLIVMGLIMHVDVWYAFIPLIVTYSFLGLAEVLKLLAQQPRVHSLSFVLTALLLVLLQIDYHNVNQPAITRAVKETSELRAIAGWISANVPSESSVSSERSGMIEYYAERPVSSFQQSEETLSDFVVSSRKELIGYEVVFKPGVASEVTTHEDRHYGIWRRK